MNVWSIAALIWVTMIDIWTKFGTRHNTTLSTRRMAISHNLKIINGGRRHLGISCHVKKKCLTPDWIKIICIKFYRIMHWTFAYTTACTTVQAMITACRLVLEHSDSEKNIPIRFDFPKRIDFFSIWFDLAHHCRIGVYIGYSLTMLSNVNIFLFTTLEQTC